MLRKSIWFAILLAALILAGCGVENLDGVSLATASFIATDTPPSTAALAVNALPPTPRPPTATSDTAPATDTPDGEPTDVEVAVAAANDQLEFGPLTNTLAMDFVGTTFNVNYPENWQENVTGQYTSVFDPGPNAISPPFLFAFAQLSSRFNLDTESETVASDAMSAQNNWLVGLSILPPEAQISPEDPYPFQWGEHSAATHTWVNRENGNLLVEIAVMDADRDRFIALRAGTAPALWPQYMPVLVEMLSTITFDGLALAGEDIAAAVERVLTPALDSLLAGELSVAEAAGASEEGTVETIAFADVSRIDLPNTFDKDFIGRNEVSIRYPDGWEITEHGTDFVVYDPATGRGALTDDSDVSLIVFYQIASQYEAIESNPDEAAAFILNEFQQDGADGGFFPHEAVVQPQDAATFRWGAYEAAAHFWRADDGSTVHLTVAVIDADQENFILFIIQLPWTLWAEQQATLLAITGSATLDGEPLPGEDLFEALSGLPAFSSPPGEVMETPASVVEVVDPLTIDLPTTFLKEFTGTEVVVNFPEGWDTSEDGSQFLLVYDPETQDDDDFQNTVGVTYFIQLSRQFDLDLTLDSVAPLVLSAVLNFNAPPEAAAAPEAVHPFTWGGHDAAAHYFRADNGIVEGLRVVVMNAERNRHVIIGVQMYAPLWEANASTLLAVMSALELDGDVLPPEELLAAINTVMGEADTLVETPEPPGTQAANGSTLTEAAIHQYLFTNVRFNYPAGWRVDASGPSLHVYDEAMAEANGPTLTVFTGLTNMADYDGIEAEFLAPYLLSDHRQNRVTVHGESSDSLVEPEDIHGFRWGEWDSAVYVWQSEDGAITGMSVATIAINNNEGRGNGNQRLVIFSTQVDSAIWEAFLPTFEEILGTVTLNGQALPASAVRTAIAESLSGN